MNVAYVDCFAGASGDMLLGALVDAGLELDALREALAGLAVRDWKLNAEKHHVPFLEVYYAAESSARASLASD